jgi:LmbE family N-acetylglucosaminyl deacetylase
MRKTLLAIVAHPDDESYGFGGTLARYAAEGVDVHVAVATDGAAGSVDEKWNGDRSKLVEVRAGELKAAVKILGAQLHTLGYRDSGYVGDSANDDPQAFINIDEEEPIGRVVGLIRTLKPQVVLTHDETGGYFHPDHIQCYKITTAAFHAAGDPHQYPDIGPEAYRPERLYYSAFSAAMTRRFIFLMRLQGQDPTRIGRNADIDATQLGIPDEKITAEIGYRKFWDTKSLASAEHASQGGGTGYSRLLPVWLQKLFFAKESYMRAYPPAAAGHKESDLFDSL